MQLTTYELVGLHFENKNYCYCSESISINYDAPAEANKQNQCNSLQHIFLG